jgi:GT2 family glycosyltransferase
MENTTVRESFKVAVVILNYNGRNFLEKFLPSIIKNSPIGCGMGFFVADNASTDDSISFLKQHYPNLNLIQIDDNQGFAGGYNTALNQIDAEYYVLLNSDVEVTSNWIGPVITLMDSDKSIAACQPKVRSFHQRDLFEYAGAAGGYIDKYGYPFCRGRIFDSCEEDLGQYNNSKEVFWATGACMFVRAGVYHQLGGLDDEFFAHMEEIDLCWRIKNEGYKVYYCADSTIYHVGGGTLQKSNPRKTFLNYRNGLALLYKNIPQNQLFKTILIRLVLDGISGVKLFISGSFSDTWAIIKAHFAFYGWMSRLKKKRKNPKQVLHIYDKSIVWAYFIKSKKKFTDLIWLAD